MTQETTLDKKHRPLILNDVFGNTGIIKAIDTTITRVQAFPSCTLLQGPSGCGKTTIARIIARMLGATGRDLKQYNIGKMRGIDAARDINKMADIAPWGNCRVIILNECHKGTNEFWNAMLEILEEPPANNHFILCTTEPGKLLKTVKTRSAVYTVKLLTVQELTNLIQHIAKKEDASLDEAIVNEIAKAANGSPRQALVILDAIIDLETIDDMMQIIRTYYTNEDDVGQLAQALINKAKWKDVATILKSMEYKEAENIRFGILGYFEKIVLNGGKPADRVAAMMDFFTTSIYSSGRPGLTQACWFALKA